MQTHRPNAKQRVKDAINRIHIKRSGGLPVIRQTHRPSTKCTVVVTCHNYGRYLAECIQSVLDQTYQASEIIVIDDSSTDNTREVAEKFNVKYLRYEHRSCYLSRKAGYENSTGEYLVFLDADDKLDANYLEQCCTALEANDRLGICSTDIQRFGNEYRADETTIVDINQRNWIHAGSMVTRLALDKSAAYGRDDLPDEICEDWYVWKKVINAGYQATKINQPLYLYRKHDGSRSIEHKRTGNYFTWAGLSIEPVTAATTDLPCHQDWITSNRIIEIVDDPSKSSNEYIFVLNDGQKPVNSVETLLRRVSWDSATVQGNGVRLIRRSSLRATRRIEAVMVTPVLTNGGAEVWVRQLATQIDPSQIHWRVVLTNPQWHERMLNPIADVAEMYSVGKVPRCKAFDNPFAAIEAASVGADVVVRWGDDSVWPIKADCPIVMVSHGVCVHTQESMQRAKAGGATHFVAVGDKCKALSMTAEMNAVTIWNGADTARLKVTRTPDDVRSNDWKIPDDWWRSENKYVGFFGRLAVEKNVMTIARAVNDLPFQYRFVTVGDGIAVNDLWPQIQGLLGKRAHHCPSVEDVGNHLNAMDVMVSVANYEANSFTLIESMFVGVPIVTTPTGAVAEFQKKSGCELFINLPDFPTVNETAVAIRQAITDGRNSDRVIAAKAFAEQYLDGKTMAGEWLKYLRGITNG